jgi:signal transduction histidine kinase
MALAVTTAALVFATVGLTIIDVWRYRTAAADDTASLASIIAENTAAAVAFEDHAAARDSLATVRVRPSVGRACLYLPTDKLFEGFGRTANSACPRSRPENVTWRVVAGTAPVERNGRVLATVYVERDLTEIGARVAVAGVTGFAMLVLAATVAFGLAHRLHRTVSTPIAQLASAARGLDPEGDRSALPEVHAAEDEVGDLVRAFTEMLRRVRDANARLVDSNVALQHEVEERRRMQAEREQLLAREREASRLKDEFLAAVSHELRTPLNAILGWLQVLATTKPTQQTIAKALASLTRNAQAQNRVIEDLLDVSRIITGKLQLKLDAVDLRAVVESTIETVAPVATAKGIHLDTDVPTAACMVHGDYDRLRQIIWNLLSNAVKFTPPGGGVALRLAHDTDRYVLSVTDTGAGILESFLPHVFERFRQADGSTTREHGGLGLGLAIVQELADLHGGTVDAASDGEGRGATFRLILPQFVGQSTIPAGHAAAPDPLPRLDGIRVLAVDDNLDALDIVTAALSDAGALVQNASSGSEALDLWRKAPSDILVCDLAMPFMDGFEVLSRIRQLDAAGKVVPAIAVTAYASDEYRQRSARAGFQGHMAKPYNTSELIRAVAAAVEPV